MPLPIPTLFEPVQAGNLHLANRIVMAPLTRNRAPGALPTAMMRTYYTQRASAGLIISEATAISHQGQGYIDVPGIWSDAQVAAWRDITDAVHAAGGKIVVQLWHVGRISHNELQPGGLAPVAPSAIVANAKTLLLRDGVPTFVATSLPRALRLDEIPGIVADYRHAARCAIQAGFDGVEVHGANGYLLDQFLRAGSNHRNDAYGGTIENRARLFMDVMQAVAQEIGGPRLGVRLSPVTPANDACDPHPQPLFDHLARQLGPLQLAYLHVIEGATGGARDHNQGETAFDYDAMRSHYRAAGGTGAWMVNNGYNAAMAQQALAQGADLVAFGRPFITNPDLPRRLRDNSPLNPLNRATLYGGGSAGYIDYPALA